MFEVEVDKPANLLFIRYAERVGVKEIQRCEQQIESLLPDLKPGFRLLTDLTRLEAMDFECIPHIKRIMDLCNKEGVEKVVRVIPDPRKDIGLSIMSLFHYDRRVHIVTCKNIDEAKRALSN